MPNCYKTLLLILLTVPEPIATETKPTVCSVTLFFTSNTGHRCEWNSDKPREQQLLSCSLLEMEECGRKDKEKKRKCCFYDSYPLLCQLSLVNSFPKRNPWSFHTRLLHVVLTWSYLASQYTPECSQVLWHAVVVDNNMLEKKQRYRKGESTLLAGFRHFWICFIDPAMQSSELLSDSSNHSRPTPQKWKI